MKKKKQNVGLLVGELENEFTHFLCEGAAGAAKELDFNLFIFPGNYVLMDYEGSHRNKYDYQNNILFSYAGTQEMDVLLIDMGTICSSLPEQEKLHFLSQFKAPIVTIESKVPGYPSVRFNSASGFHTAISHLIEKHGCRRIGFVSGPKESDCANDRLAVYRSVLEEHGIPYVDSRVVYGNFLEYSEEIVSALLHNNPDLDAVVFANDMMALGGYRVFRSRGIKIGEDISVVGFDDALCAMDMTPSLTTVKADSMELGYHAGMYFQELLATGKDMLVDSVFIPRESCGCQGKGFCHFQAEPEALLCDEQLDTILEEMYLLLFGRSNHQKRTAKIKEAITEYVTFFRDSIIREDAKKRDWDGLRARMMKITHMELAPYTDMAKIFLLFDSMYAMAKRIIGTTDAVTALSEAYSKYYKAVAKYENQLADSQKVSLDRFNLIATTFNRDVLNYTIGDDRAYCSIVDKIMKLYYKSFYLCLFDKPVTYVKDRKINLEKELLIKAYTKGEKAGCVPAERQRQPVQGLLTRLCQKQEKDTVVIVTLLYSAQEQYGLLVHEVPVHYMNYITPINAQISSAIGMLELLKNKDIITLQLEESLAKIKETNAILDELSKSDELTHIYNRRGFLTTVQYQIAYEKNQSRRALVIFADMNNLKTVNDRFGHEEGDFSLKMIAAALKEALPNGIVGRFGGDEFAGFTMLPPGGNVKEIRERIKWTMQEYNENNDKPYYVSISVGVCEFLCGSDVQLGDLMDQADVDLYLEKKHKRSNILKN